MAPSDANSSLSFSPGGTLAEAILIDLSSPHASLASVAAKHHIPLATLSLWLTRPETQALLHAIESGGYTHTRLAAALNLSAAVPVLLQILTDFRTLAATTADPTDPAYQRASVSARKAAWMLLRLASAHPLTPAQLSAARDTLGATRAAAPSHDTTTHTNPIASNPITASPIAMAPAATDASPPNAPAHHSHRDTQPREESTSHPSTAFPKHTATTSNITAAPTSSTQPAPTHAARAEPAPSTTAEPQPTTSSARSSTPPGDLSDLVTHLSSIAESLGIDISDLDEIAAGMAQHATGPPHEATAR